MHTQPSGGLAALLAIWWHTDSLAAYHTIRTSGELPDVRRKSGLSANFRTSGELPDIRRTSEHPADFRTSGGHPDNSRTFGELPDFRRTSNGLPDVGELSDA